MSPNEFKSYKKEEFNKALQEKCNREGLTVNIISGIQVTMFGANPENTTIYCINNEAYALYNDGNKIQWNFVGNIN